MRVVSPGGRKRVANAGPALVRVVMVGNALSSSHLLVGVLVTPPLTASTYISHRLESAPELALPTTHSLYHAGRQLPCEELSWLFWCLSRCHGVLGEDITEDSADERAGLAFCFHRWLNRIQ